MRASASPRNSLSCGLRDTLMEDGPTMEAIQANLLSGVKRDYILQDQEILIRHSHHVLKRIHDQSGLVV